MPESRLLYLTQHQMLAYRWQGGRCLPEGEFAVEAAATDFATYLKQHQKSLFTMVTNIAEEGFKLENIPYVQGRDRQAIVERKLGQHFPGAPLSFALSLGHEKTSRRNERLLMTALTSASLLDPWVTALRAAEARLVGIHSLPLLSDQIINRLHLPKERSIFVTVQDNSVRQSFLDRGHLVFSRVAPLSNSSIEGITQNIISEISRLQQYLQTQRLITRNETIVAHVMLDPRAHQALAQEEAPTGIRISALDLLDCARRLGVKTPPQDSRAETLFLHAAAAFPPSQQFATPALRKEYRLWTFGKALRAASTIVFMTCLLYAGRLHLEQQAVSDRILQLNAKTDDKDRRYRAVVATFPPMPMANDALRLIVDRLQTLQKDDRTPDDLLRTLSLALNKTPEVELTSLDWTNGTASAGAQAPAPAGAGDGTEALTVRGTVYAGRNSNPRQLLDVFDGFVGQLKSAGQLEVNIQKQPFDVTSGKALKSGEGMASASSPREFEFRLVRSSKP